MKKYLKMMAMALVVIAVTVGFASCGDDDPAPAPEQPKAIGAKVSFDFTYPEDLLNVADVTFTYTDADGSAKTEKITSASFKRDIIYKKLPVTVIYSSTATLKSDFTHKEKYNLKFSKTIAYSYLMSDGQYSIINISSISAGSAGVPDANLADYIAKYPSTHLPVGEITIEK